MRDALAANNPAPQASPSSSHIEVDNSSLLKRIGVTALVARAPEVPAYTPTAYHAQEPTTDVDGGGSYGSYGSPWRPNGVLSAPLGTLPHAPEAPVAEYSPFDTTPLAFPLRSERPAEVYDSTPSASVVAAATAGIHQSRLAFLAQAGTFDSSGPMAVDPAPTAAEERQVVEETTKSAYGSRKSATACDSPSVNGDARALPDASTRRTVDPATNEAASDGQSEDSFGEAQSKKVAQEVTSMISSGLLAEPDVHVPDWTAADLEAAIVAANATAAEPHDNYTVTVTR